MPATLRQLRERRTSVAATMKITRAMELIAASRVTKAQQRARQSVPYNEELVRAVATLAAHADAVHPLTTEPAESRRAAVLVISADRGMAGAYNTNVFRHAEGLLARLRQSGKEIELYTCGKKAHDYFSYRDVPIERAWEGFSFNPHYADAKVIGECLIDEFLRPTTDDGGVDELHLVFTRFRSLVSQQTQIVRLLPLEVVEIGSPESDEEDDAELAAAETNRSAEEYFFEPDAETVLDRLLPLYIINRLRFALMEAAASELAARQQAMHSATDNAKQLIDTLTRDANQARQAEITQEINEIVGGAGALTDG